MKSSDILLRVEALGVLDRVMCLQMRKTCELTAKMVNTNPDTAASNQVITKPGGPYEFVHVQQLQEDKVLLLFLHLLGARKF